MKDINKEIVNIYKKDETPLPFEFNWGEMKADIIKGVEERANEPPPPYLSIPNGVQGNSRSIIVAIGLMLILMLLYLLGSYAYKNYVDGISENSNKNISNELYTQKADKQNILKDDAGKATLSDKNVIAKENKDITASKDDIDLAIKNVDTKASVKKSTTKENAGELSFENDTEITPKNNDKKASDNKKSTAKENVGELSFENNDKKASNNIKSTTKESEDESSSNYDRRITPNLLNDKLPITKKQIIKSENNNIADGKELTERNTTVIVNKNNATLLNDNKNIAEINKGIANNEIIEPIEKKKSGLLLNNDEQATAFIELNNDEIILNSFKQRKISHHLQLDGGFTFMPAYYKKSENLLFETEKGFPSNYLNLSYSLSFNNGFYFSGGIMLSRLKTKFELSDTLVRSEMWEEVLAKKVNNAYTNEFITDLYEKIPLLTSREIRFYNRFDAVNIPLTIGKRFYFNKLSYQIGIGTNLSIFNQSEGLTLRENEIVFYPTTEVEPYHNKMQLAALAETGIGIAINQRTEIIANFRYQIHLKDWSPDVIIVKPQSILLGTGLKFNF